MIKRKTSLIGLNYVRAVDKKYNLLCNFVYKNKHIPNCDDFITEKDITYKVYGKVFDNQKRCITILAQEH
jgi:hypothetical protein